MSIFRKFDRYTEDQITEACLTKTYHSKPLEQWQLRRLKIVKDSIISPIGKAAVMNNVSRQTVGKYCKVVKEKSLYYLFQRKTKGGSKATLDRCAMDQFSSAITSREINNLVEAQMWIQKKTGKLMSESGVRKVILRLRTDSEGGIITLAQLLRQE